jgi:NADH-quinone oxidoreductase subunit L
MVTHAFFKALMFLGSGSVIHGLGGEQDMRRMGALRKVMPITAITFIVGWLAIAGVPPFAGFWSKDEILLYAFEKSPVLWAVGFATAILTAFYMSRQVFLVFFGEAKWDRSIEEAAPELAAEREANHVHEGHGAGPSGPIHPHESPWTMTTPLVILAGLAVIGGGINIPILERLKNLEHWLHDVVIFDEAHLTQPTGIKVGLAVVAIAGSLIGVSLGAAVYLRKRQDLAARIEQPIFAKGWYYDSSIAAFMGGPGRKAFDAVAWFDKHVIDGAVNGVATGIGKGADRGRLLQTGYVRNYALAMAFGVVVVAALLLSKAVF